MSEPIWEEIRSLTKAQKAAAVMSALAIGLVTIVPYAVAGAVRYDSLVAVTLVMAIAIIFTAAFAADNLIEFRAATDAEYTPVIDVRLSDVHESGKDRQLLIELRNIGRGIAAGLEASLWWTDSDMVVWIPHRVQGVQDLLKPGESTGSRIDHPGLHIVFQRHFRPGLPDLVLQLRYRDGRKRSQEVHEVYELIRDEVTGTSSLIHSPQAPPAELTSLGGKQKLLDEEIERLGSEFDLKSHGLVVRGSVGRRWMGVKVIRGDEELWEARTGVDSPVYHLGEWARPALEDLIAQSTSVEDEVEPGDSWDSETNPNDA